MHPLAHALTAHCLPELLPHTRLSTIRSPEGTYALKREDDLWLGGNKLRKAASLIPHLLRQGIQQVALIGGAYSNNVLALAQLLPQYGIGVTAFLRGEPHTRQLGNHALIRQLLPPDRIHWVPRSQWPQAEQLAADWLQQQATPERWQVLPEGARVPAALAGAATLALDIARNEAACAAQAEAQAKTHHDELWLDVGTGLTAAATLLVDHVLYPDRQYHLVLMAEDAVAFSQVMAWVQAALSQQLGTPLKAPQNVVFHRPPYAPRFGHVSAQVRAFIQTFAHKHGILPDPIYGAKLLAALETHKTRFPTSQHSQLAVLSGGQQALFGYVGEHGPQT